MFNPTPAELTRPTLAQLDARIARAKADNAELSRKIEILKQANAQADALLARFTL